MTGVIVTGITVTGITVTGMTMTGMIMTGTLRMAGVIQTRHTRCHTDGLVCWYYELFSQPLPLGCVVIY